MLVKYGLLIQVEHPVLLCQIRLSAEVVDGSRFVPRLLSDEALWDIHHVHKRRQLVTESRAPFIIYHDVKLDACIEFCQLGPWADRSDDCLCIVLHNI